VCSNSWERSRSRITLRTNRAVRRAYDADVDVDAALVPDMQGIGSGPDVMSRRPSSASPHAPDIRRALPDPAGIRHE
jgi:hypothetical protein